MLNGYYLKSEVVLPSFRALTASDTMSLVRTWTVGDAVFFRLSYGKGNRIMTLAGLLEALLLLVVVIVFDSRRNKG